MSKTMDELVALASKFIAKNGIMNEDVKQEIYIKALESKDLKSNQQVNKKLTKVLRDTMNKEDMFTQIHTSMANPFDVFEIVNRDILYNQLECIMDNTMSERDKKILKLRYIDGETQKEIGKLFHLTGSRISTIEHSAIRRLRYLSRLNSLNDFLSNPSGPVAKNNDRRVEYN